MEVPDQVERWFCQPKVLKPQSKQIIANAIMKFAQEAMAHVPKESNIYAGSSGIGWMICRLRRHGFCIEEDPFSFVSIKREKDVGFLKGSSGPLALGLVLEKDEKYIEAVSLMTSSSSSFESGLAGFLYALGFLKAIGIKGLEENIQKIVVSLIDQGKEERYGGWPLLWSSRDGNVYLGVGVGIVGVCTVLLKSNSMDKHDTALVKNTLLRAIIPEAKRRSPIQDLRESNDESAFFGPSGIRKALLGEDLTNISANWCDGIAGIVISICYLFNEPGLFTEDEKKALLEQAKYMAQTVWEKRGDNIGLCHGLAGCGYMFLHLYHLTDNDDYFVKATACAELVIGAETTDYSLFNGKAGAACFLADLLSSQEESFIFGFPCYSDSYQ